MHSQRKCSRLMTGHVMYRTDDVCNDQHTQQSSLSLKSNPNEKRIWMLLGLGKRVITCDVLVNTLFIDRQFHPRDFFGDSVIAVPSDTSSGQPLIKHIQVMCVKVHRQCAAARVGSLCNLQ